MSLSTCPPAFLEGLHQSGQLWALRDFRIPRLVPRGTASQDFGESLKVILTLADRYPAQSLPLYILRAFAQFLPALLMPCSRRGKPRHISSNAKRFQKGEWEHLWNQALRLNKKEVTHSCLLYTSPSPRDGLLSRMPSSA